MKKAIFALAWMAVGAAFAAVLGLRVRRASLMLQMRPDAGQTVRRGLQQGDWFRLTRQENDQLH